MPNCKSGDMAFVVKVSDKDIGKVVKVISVATSQELDAIRASPTMGLVWKVDKPLHWKRQFSGEFFTTPFCPDFNLIPINGDLVKDEVFEEKEIQKPVETK